MVQRAKNGLFLAHFANPKAFGLSLSRLFRQFLLKCNYSLGIGAWKSEDPHEAYDEAQKGRRPPSQSAADRSLS